MSQQLPSDTIYEILIRTAVLETLDTCKIVSKEWKEMIDDSKFLSLYSKRSGNLFGYFIQYIEHNKWISMYVPGDELRGDEKCLIDRSWARNDDTRVLASSNQGLLCCQKRFGRNYRWYICKPATKQWRSMPNPKLRLPTVGVAVVVFRSRPLHYNVIRLSKERKIVESMIKYRSEIFDTKSWGWREGESIRLPYEEYIMSQHPPITLGRFVYWQTNEENMLEFDIGGECFEKLSLSLWHNIVGLEKTKNMDDISFPEREYHILETFEFRSDQEYVDLRGG